tara:strand:- start:242427 stop:242588 length:162 start_codon:yes stop_codon:yes gene_type:complete
MVVANFLLSQWAQVSFLLAVLGLASMFLRIELMRLESVDLEEEEGSHSIPCPF